MHALYTLLGKTGSKMDNIVTGGLIFLTCVSEHFYRGNKFLFVACFCLFFVMHRFNNDVSSIYGILLCCLVLFHFNFLFVLKQSTVRSKNKSYWRYCQIKSNFLHRFRFVFFNDDKGINHVENRQNILMKLNIITRRWELGICFQVVLSMLAIKSWLKPH